MKLTARSRRQITKAPLHLRDKAASLADGQINVRVYKDKAGDWCLSHAPFYDPCRCPRCQERFYLDKPAALVEIIPYGE